MRRLLLAAVTVLALIALNHVTPTAGQPQGDRRTVFPRSCALWEVMYVGEQIYYYCDYFPEECDNPEPAYVINPPLSPVPYEDCECDASCVFARRGTGETKPKAGEKKAAPKEEDSAPVESPLTIFPTRIDHLPIDGKYLYEPPDEEDSLSSVLVDAAEKYINMEITGESGAKIKVTAGLYLLQLQCGMRRAVNLKAAGKEIDEERGRECRFLYVALQSRKSDANAPVVRMTKYEPPIGPDLPAGCHSYTGEYRQTPIVGFVRDR